LLSELQGADAGTRVTRRSWEERRSQRSSLRNLWFIILYSTAGGSSTFRLHPSAACSKKHDSILASYLTWLFGRFDILFNWLLPLFSSAGPDDEFKLGRADLARLGEPSGPAALPRIAERNNHREGVPMRADKEKHRARGRNLEEAAQAALRKSSDTGLSDVRCEYREGVLTLHGRVHSYYHKQLAQEIARSVEKSMVVDNQIRVDPAVVDVANGADLKNESTSFRLAARALPAPRPNARAPGKTQ
jgi:hypothetical protein